MWGLSLLAFVTYISHSSCHSNQDNIHKNNHLLDQYKWRHADKVNLHSHQYLPKKVYEKEDDGTIKDLSTGLLE